MKEEPYYHQPLHEGGYITDQQSTLELDIKLLFATT
jgi:hypothetical protein